MQECVICPLCLNGERFEERLTENHVANVRKQCSVFRCVQSVGYLFCQHGKSTSTVDVIHGVRED